MDGSTVGTEDATYGMQVRSAEDVQVATAGASNMMSDGSVSMGATKRLVTMECSVSMIYEHGVWMEWRQ